MLSKLGKNQLYNDKVDFVDKNIEKDIKFFKPNYVHDKKEVYELRCKIR